MAVADVVTFCQSDFLSASFAAFEGMRRRKHLCDITITIQNQSFTAHRMILEAGIPYFGSVFLKGGSETEETDGLPEDLESIALESLIDFAYSGKVNISNENARSLLVASHYLKLNQVLDACAEFLSSRLSVNNILEVRTLAHSLNNPKLIESSDNFILENFEEFSKSGDFASLPAACVKEIISKDNLNISSEEVVFEAVIHWVKNSPSERQAKLLELLSEIRMVHLPTDYLIDRVSSEELVRTSMPCREYVEQVKNYHLSKNRSAFSNLKTQPRIYNSVKDKIYAICANGGTSQHSVLYCDFVKETWLSVASKAYERKDHIYLATIVKEKIYMFLKDTIQTFHLGTLEWEVLESRHDDLMVASVSSYGNSIYCFGMGHHNNENKVRCFDTLQNKWLEETTMRAPRSALAAATLGESIWVLGGLSSINHICFDIVEKYNPSIGQWSEVAPMLTKRFFHCCVAMKENIYVCGGANSDCKYLRTAEMYDSLTNRWNFISSVETERARFSLVCSNRKIYALGGFTPDHKRTLKVEIYDPESDQWKPGFNAPYGFRRAVAV